MTSKSRYEKNLDSFAPYYYDDENHIDSLNTLTLTFEHIYISVEFICICLYSAVVIHFNKVKLFLLCEVNDIVLLPKPAGDKYFVC